MNKAIVSGVSIILVVGVCIGVIVGVSRKNSSDNDDAVLSTTSKAVSAICSPTDFKQACVDSLGSLANNGSATPKDFLEVAIKATVEKVQAAMNNSQSIFGKFGSNDTQKMAMDDCKDLLQFAVDELQASFSTVGDSDMHTLSDREAELKNWLSAVISYQESCLDGITQPELKTDMSNGLLNASQLTSNALAIVSAIAGIFNAFNIHIPSLNTNATSRRLLDASETDDGGYPAWISAADRRLLASNNNGNLKPNAVVAKDGSGQYKTIGAALAAYPKNLKGRYVIYVKAGVYNEYITVTKDQVNVFMYGDGPRRTLVTGKKCNRDGITTMNTASFGEFDSSISFHASPKLPILILSLLYLAAAVGSGFIAKSMGFQNTAGPEGHQAVALRVQSDQSAFYNCRMDGYQDTLYTQTHRQFYRNCVISGTVDFIFGDAAVVIQNSLIICRKPMDNQQNTITAHGRTNKRETTGLIIQNCRIVPEQLLFPVRFKIPSYLGRPWKEYSRTVIMESTIGDLIQPAGWLEWQGNFALNTLYYAEYANQGPGAVTNRRVRWRGFKVISNRNEAAQFTVGPFIQGGQWLQNTGAPYFLSFRK
ncbi:Pectinesterase domain-containing protein/PMEI domain-containing protein [Cephalotus follicularis]|uniref:Pectinesterase n=1 Tax=Cephalotus follicularis TaxID=3775 RepID=A0A1Q3CE67_CEPFO|nr:Pectinesterase domain-containing protein/PMEI domain-containing protein [Cephalotus follicularis]